MAPHTYPPFYACYLLKSVHFPATYIGSTPNPLRRIRQHNGELTQGATKTKRKRPWVMQMLVHGFPSKLSALQFEWVWQNPHLSRHLPESQRRAKALSSCVKCVHSMIATPPFDSLALRVILFTPFAHALWHKLPPAALPPAYRPDGPSTLQIPPLPGKTPATTCSVCTRPLDGDALTTAICSMPTCSASSHLICLASHFADRRMLPRGGHCPGCGEYVLWGDIVKAMYDRADTDGSTAPSLSHTGSPC
ncbi:uncharacterized protein BT62DRAFT_928334 [Guyanagaster necrorhizus]|uniref:GIY-YIG domain-containing protein n=1 Tax=Guyanagaster necrorhizus TaxID=856835 RepID=A0A9P7VXY8_9AGAR|nr:uncharacterized protein BT62DRAFT_928334 [Guyanagaster necrorhizus MCA 3950]KAG7449611.1 hypothetical protein BT62DRAFT_928334 [Guyanagaster necrorhizus MCA 3950]